MPSIRLKRLRIHPNGDVSVASALVDHGADPNILDWNGRGAFNLAAHGVHTDIVQILFDAGADPNASRKSGTTPLIVAAFDGHLEKVKALLAPGANPYVRSDQGMNVRDCADMLSHSQLVEILNVSSVK